MERRAFKKSWLNSTSSNLSIVSSFENVSINCLSTYFDTKFNWIDMDHTDGACSDSLPR
jgi:hypothetical protein